ncbi:hypothetical protein [Pedobacter soli]|uniref:Uncharacterized protein n=1 Tax=Pedobacter soli TaxID=390242 RepID=A0A1G6WRT4_9SPHI|nr:hypothetical protein [Pedobacter soli]SDD68494.1 hypothetical protein SAMN04488024_107103 [Pedobacter soli]
MKNSNKLFEKQIELKNSQISGGRASGESYKNQHHTFTDQHGCTVTVAVVLTDNDVKVEECFFTNCP